MASLRRFVIGGSVPAFWLCAAARATVQILSLTPSLPAPQPVGTPITWTATATDSRPSRLTFQFNVGVPGQSMTIVRDFNAGAQSAGVWTSVPFVWAPTSYEGAHQIRVVIKDFTSGETATKTVQYQISPLVTGTASVVVPTANPLVALFSAPSCASGSSMRVSFQPQSKAAPAMSTNWVACHPPHTMTFEIAGMYPTTTYQLIPQTQTNGKIVNGAATSFTTGALPGNVPIPTFSVVVPVGPDTDTTDHIILHNPINLTRPPHFPNVATDLGGNVLWYYYPNDPTKVNTLARPLAGGTFLSLEDGVAWNPAAKFGQYLRQVDLAGNLVRETNTGVIQQALLAMGAADAAPCVDLPSPPPIGTACLGTFHHDAIESLPNGGVALLADVEKIYPPGTQGNTSGLPVDIVGDMIIVLDPNWQTVWYFDAFEHASGPPQLDINRAAVLNETCSDGANTGCPPLFLLGPGVAPDANDWLHANSLYYRPSDGNIIWSSRHQDWVMKIDYRNGGPSATGNVLWRLGPDGDFTFINVNNDPWPWFSHQHEAGIENNGAGPMTLFDNGNTRLAAPPLGLGPTGCQPNDCNSRGMALMVDETKMQVTPVISVDLGFYAQAMGSAQLLSNGNYFFLPALVPGNGTVYSYSIEIFPTPGTLTGNQVSNVQGPEHYRAWRMPNLYTPPTT